MALSSILVPAVASTNWGAEGLIVLRIICGFGAVRFGAIELFYQYDYNTSHSNTSLLILKLHILNHLQGVTYPAMHNLIARWIPKSERSRAATFIWSGIKRKNV